jgi:hypothetical protein
MKNTLRKTLTGLVILSLILLLTGWVVFKYAFPDKYFWFFPCIILIFLLVNGGFFAFFYRSLKKSDNQFIRNFMVSTGIKLMIYVLLILVYILTSPATAVAFAVSLAVIYLCYTLYDVLIMLSLLKHKKENKATPDQFSN